MKKQFFLFSLMLLTMVGFSQNKEASIPKVDIKTVYGETFNTSQIENDGNPIILSFWATWCKPCIKELNTINDVYIDWQDETNVKLIAVSIDNTRSSSKVLPLVNGKGWEYEVLLDPNGDLKRAMGVNMIPHTFLIDGKRNIVWQHTSFSEGSELELIDMVRKLANGETIEE
ncbi:MAG: TlpA disulfide reductase family protein [Bacteroidota bacterium]|nr:TlpA disulfide reductase family protein [Bacteroidota bacterium]